MLALRRRFVLYVSKHCDLLQITFVARIIIEAAPCKGCRGSVVWLNRRVHNAIDSETRLLRRRCRAIAIVDRALEKFGAPIYDRHEFVHNKHVVDDLKSRGAIFVGELQDVPDLLGGAVVIYSAHGV